MGKNTKVYRYFDLGFKWESWVLEEIQRDAELHQMSDQVGKFLGVRVVEYYRLVALGIIIPGVTVNAQPNAVQPRQVVATRPEADEKPESHSSRGRPPERQARPVPAPSNEEVDIEESEDADDNADAFLDQMMADMEDDEEDDEEAEG